MPKLLCVVILCFTRKACEETRSRIKSRVLALDVNFLIGWAGELDPPIEIMAAPCFTSRFEAVNTSFVFLLCWDFLLLFFTIRIWLDEMPIDRCREKEKKKGGPEICHTTHGIPANRTN